MQQRTLDQRKSLWLDRDAWEKKIVFADGSEYSNHFPVWGKNVVISIYKVELVEALAALIS